MAIETPASFYDPNGYLYSIYCDCAKQDIEFCECYFDERYAKNPDYSVLPLPRDNREKKLFDCLELSNGHWIYTPPPKDIRNSREGGNTDHRPHGVPESALRGHRSVWKRVGRGRGYLPAGSYLGCAPHCGETYCARPDHRVIETPSQNVGRYDSPPGVNARKTHCPRGHAYDEENTIIYRGGRKCRACTQTPEYRAKNTARKAASKARKQAEYDALVARVAELEAQLAATTAGVAE